MFPLGFIILTLGAFLVDSAYKNRAPIKTLDAIIGDPKHMRDILNNSAGTGYAPTYSPGVSGPPPSPADSSVQAPSAAAAKAIAWARTQIGKPYAWGASGPNAFDCSGLVQQAYAHAGVTLPRTTFFMLTVGKAVKKTNLLPGDLVFPDAGHVQIYTGNGMVIEAPHTGLKVREVKMWGFMTARRVANVTAPPKPPRGSGLFNDPSVGSGNGSNPNPAPNGSDLFNNPNLGG